MELKSEHNEQTERVKAPYYYYYLLILEILRSPRALGDLILPHCETQLALKIAKKTTN